VSARQLTSEQRWLRAGGFDWPLQGLTMVGLARLDDLQECVESVVEEDIEGDLIEAGCWRGGASIFARATLDALGAEGRTVYVADSFRGFPASTDTQSDRERLSEFDFLAVPEEEVRANFARFGCDRGVTIVPGFFEDTLPGISGRTWSVVRLDGDTYDATWFALEQLYPGLSVGGYLIVDDYGALNECRRAVDEFREAHGVTEPLEEVDWTCRRWRRESAAPIEPGKAPQAQAHGNGRHADRSVARPPRARVPTEAELQLERELALLREQLAATSAEVDRLRGSPYAGPKAWLGGKLRRRGGRA
jgi:O-methyltransferase